MNNNLLLDEIFFTEIWRVYTIMKTIHKYESQRKNLFLATCRVILGPKKYNREKIMSDVPHGGIIGVNNSKLDIIFRHFKIFRLHAALHDAFGYCRSNYNEGPGYSYVVKCNFNSCLIGHVTGLIYATYICVFKKNQFNKLPI